MPEVVDAQVGLLGVAPDLSPAAPHPLGGERLKDRNGVHKLADTIRAATDPPDISAVMAEVEELLDASIGPKGYVIREPKGINLDDDSGPPYRPDHCIDLGRIDFDALAAFFEKNKQPRVTIAALQKTARKKLEELVRNNPTRRDVYDKLEEPRPRTSSTSSRPTSSPSTGRRARESAPPSSMPSRSYPRPTPTTSLT